jgi:hypothetical protein
MIQTNLNEKPVNEETGLLQSQIACLQRLIAELLLKNQRLRDALGR